MQRVQPRLDFDEVGLAQVDELGVLRRVLGVPPGHQRQAVHRALVLVLQRGQAAHEPVLAVGVLSSPFIYINNDGKM